MAKKIRRWSRRMLGLDPEMGFSPPSSPNNPSNEENIREDIASEVESIPPIKTKIGVVKTLNEGFLHPFNPPLAYTSILVLFQVLSQFATTSHQRYTSEMDEPTLGLIGFPSTTQSVIVPIILLLMGGKIPRNKGVHCPFHKSQLDS